MPTLYYTDFRGWYHTVLLHVENEGHRNLRWTRRTSLGVRSAAVGITCEESGCGFVFFITEENLAHPHDPTNTRMVELQRLMRWSDLTRNQLLAQILDPQLALRQQLRHDAAALEGEMSLATRVVRAETKADWERLLIGHVATTGHMRLMVSNGTNPLSGVGAFCVACLQLFQVYDRAIAEDPLYTEVRQEEHLRQMIQEGLVIRSPPVLRRTAWARLLEPGDE